MTRIICDTMIWYELSKNTIQVPDPKQYTLVCTKLSLMELAFSPNNLIKLAEVQAAIREIVKVKPQIILHYPWDHATSLIDKDFEFDFEIEEDLAIGYLNFLLNHPKEELFPDSFKENLEDISSTRRKNFQEWADFLNNLYGRNNEIKRTLKKYSDANRHLLDFKKWFIHKLNERELGTYSVDTFPWEQFEFYTSIGASYMRKMMFSRMKADGNDENDLRNMIYAQPGDKYWTLEKRWNNLAKEAKMTKYLYQHNE